MNYEENRMEVSLNQLADVQKFAHIASNCPSMISILSGAYCVDGKSILGILSLDLSRPLVVRFEDINDMAKFEQFKA